jgi:hypothetical protein
VLKISARNTILKRGENYMNVTIRLLAVSVFGAFVFQAISFQHPASLFIGHQTAAVTAQLPDPPPPECGVFDICKSPKTAQLPDPPPPECGVFDICKSPKTA